MDTKLEKMTEANRITHRILESCKELILNSDAPMSTAEVEIYVQLMLNRLGLESAFKGLYDFPGLLCISLNDEVIHGLPKEEVKIQEGDIVSLDFGVKLGGYCSDAAITFLNQKRVLPGNSKARLIKDTEKAMNEAIASLEKSFPNCHVGDVTETIDNYKNKYGIVDEFYGHEIGTEVHQGDLRISNTIDKMQDDRLLTIGQVITIEPMFTLGSGETYIDEDGYAVKTKDGSLAAHFECSVAITKDGVKVLK